MKWSNLERRVSKFTRKSFIGLVRIQPRASQKVSKNLEKECLPRIEQYALDTHAGKQLSYASTDV